MPEEAEVMTVEMKINLLAPAAGDRLVAAGRVIRAGRRISAVTAEVFAETAGGRDLIAILQGTMVPVTARTRT
jgi:acyl-coenzyme A thioesterase PaaI-like protein